MAAVDYDKLADDLEKQELDAPNGVPPTHIYEQLLAIYLFQKDLTGAKFLWKRIPSNAKSGSTELGNIWAVGEHLWRRDLPGVYKALNREWSNNVKEIMQAVFEKTRQRAVELVGRAYTSIRAEDFAQLVGMTEEEAVKAAQGYGWGFDEATRMILPTPPTTPPQQPVPSDEQLKRLTDYIAFLEN
ncbi:COP9 signalosome subunit 8 isoform X2 [Oratosquilla oratoria]|uniref:COP9 signalosome subunit 8 isoform X2 n=1 Tax=Oratosquilla oratoria TaxID=337810 RepID=UPI003F76A99D